MAADNFADDQALWLQTRAGEDDIHHQSWSDCIAANAKKKTPTMPTDIQTDVQFHPSGCPCLEHPKHVRYYMHKPPPRCRPITVT